MASIKLKHASGNSTILNSPAANPTNDVTLKLPSTTGSAGQVLKVASANHSSTNAELEFAADAGGKIVQMVADIKKDTGSYSTSSSFAATGMSVTITPQSASNTLLVIANLAIGNSGNSSTQWKLYRGTSEITAANSTGVTNKAFMWVYVPQSGDNPTYQNIIGSGVYEHDIQDTNSHEINLYVNSFSTTAYLNRRGYSADFGGISSLVVMEVAA